MNTYWILSLNFGISTQKCVLISNVIRFYIRCKIFYIYAIVHLHIEACLPSFTVLNVLNLKF